MKGLEIVGFQKKKCFLCGKECDEYVHFECAWSYFDEKTKRIKEANLKYEK